MPENSHYRLCVNPPFTALPKLPSSTFFSPDIGRTLALRPCNYGIASRNGRVPRMFVQHRTQYERGKGREKGGRKSRVFCSFEGSDKIGYNVESWTLRGRTFLDLFRLEWPAVCYRCFDISRLVSTASKFSLSDLSHRTFNFHESHACMRFVWEYKTNPRS